MVSDKFPVWKNEYPNLLIGLVNRQLDAEVHCVDKSSLIIYGFNNLPLPPRRPQVCHIPDTR